jgi:hypothetical protein
MLNRIIEKLVITIGVVALSVVLLCIGALVYQDWQPTATEQLLRLADLPTDIQLPPAHVGLWEQHDFRQVTDVLVQRVPLGTPKAGILSFLHGRGKPCDQEVTALLCMFDSEVFPCHTTISLRWFLTISDTLDHIEITESHACL